MKKLIVAVILCTLFGANGEAQVAVSLAPVARQQFFNSTGTPLAGGCVSFFAAGTTTQQAAYSDITGLYQLQNPLTLDNSGMATIYLANQSYKIQVNAAPGSGSCASNNLGAQQWVQDNVSSYQVISSISNLIFAGVTVDPSGSAGEIGYRSDIPCFRVFTTLWDCVATLNGVQTIANKTLTAPIINNASGATLISPSIAGLTIGGVAVATGNPTNFVNFTNGAAGTTLNSLAKLVVNGSGVNAVNTVTTDTGGVVGITIGGGGTSGIAIIQRTGQVLCTFDGSTTADDYVQISTTVAGDCHDGGVATYPTTGNQVIGRALTTNTGVGSYLIDLFPPEIRSGGSISTVESTWPIVMTQGLNVGAPYTFAQVVLAQPHMLTRFVISIGTALSGCSTSPVVQFTDITSSTVLTSTTLTNSAAGTLFDSGVLSVSMTSGHTFGIILSTAAVGCTGFGTSSTATAVFH
jgi:hypothetical protein